MSNIFCKDFLTSFFADLLAGLILAALVGFPLNWWANRKLNELKRGQQRKDEKRADLEKAIRYLEILKIDVNHLLDALLPVTDRQRQLVDQPLLALKEARQARIDTALWDILQPSGELPRLLDADLLGTLSRFYEHLVYARRAQSFIIGSHLASPFPDAIDIRAIGGKQPEYANMMLSGVKEALESGRGLPDKLDSEIRRLKAELQKP